MRIQLQRRINRIVTCCALTSAVLAVSLPTHAHASVSPRLSAPTSAMVLCDKRQSRNVIIRQQYPSKCPAGWTTARPFVQLCSRRSDLARKAFWNARSVSCPQGWIKVLVDPGLVCTIRRDTFKCGFTPGGPKVTVAPTTTTTATTTTTTTITTTTTTTVRPTTTTVAPTTTSRTSTFDALAYEAEVLRLTNVERTANGLAPLSACARLQSAARGHSRRMNEGQFREHDDPGTGTSIVDRISATGYLAGAGAWRVGENIAWGFATAAQNVQWWMNSPGHRANILDARFTHLGVGVHLGVINEWRGVYSNWDFVPYSTQNFGTGGSC
jgi:uncharacterized protein YkwD